MNFWMKYKHRSSSSGGRWEWVLLHTNNIDEAKQDAETRIEEMDQSDSWSEHHRGYAWEVVTEAPLHIVKANVSHEIGVIERSQTVLNRLQEEVYTAKECNCVGEHDYSSYCMHCGRVLTDKAH